MASVSVVTEWGLLNLCVSTTTCRVPKQPMLLDQAACPYRAVNMRPTGTGTDATHAGGAHHVTTRTTTQVTEKETRGRRETALARAISSSANHPSPAGGVTPHTMWEDAMAADPPTPTHHPGERWLRYIGARVWWTWSKQKLPPLTEIVTSVVFEKNSRWHVTFVGWGSWWEPGWSRPGQ